MSYPDHPKRYPPMGSDSAYAGPNSLKKLRITFHNNQSRLSNSVTCNVEDRVQYSKPGELSLSLTFT